MSQLTIVNDPLSFSRFLSIQSAYGPSFSPDGKQIAFLSNLTGLPQAWTIDAQGGWPNQLTFDNNRVMSIAWSPTGQGLIFTRDIGGNENTQLYWVQVDGTGERRLTRDDGAMHIFGAWSADGATIAYAANRRERSRYDIWLQDLTTGQERVVWQNDAAGFLAPVSFAPAPAPGSARLLVMLMSSALDEDLFELELGKIGGASSTDAGALAGGPATVRHLTPHTGDVRFSGPAYSAQGDAVFCLCDLDRDARGVVRLNLGSEAGLELHWLVTPAVEVDDLAISPDSRWLVWAENHSGAHRLTALELATGRQQPAAGLPVGAIVPSPADFDVSSLAFSPDSQRLAFSFSSSTRTADIWQWSLSQGSAAPVTRSSHAGLALDRFIEPQLVQYPSFDGRQIPAWFYRVETALGERRPVLVYVHGGPEGQTQAILMPILQYFAQCGFHVLAPNVRGSSGYGKTYMNLDNVEKRPDSVADLAHAVYWLRQQPQVDGRRIAVYGGSYGGFMVLAALTQYPDLWAAGVDLVGIANFVTFLENTGPYRRSVREAEYGSLARDRAVLEAISPIHRVDQITAPLMVIHGRNDPRVPLSEAQQVVDALHARDVPVEFLVYADEGHGLVKLANKLDAYPQAAAFLQKYLI